MWTRSFRAMGTEVEVKVGEERDAFALDTDRVYEDIVKTIEGFEAKFSRFRGDSELSIVNAHPGVWFDISVDLATVLQLASDAYALTNGIFHPGLGNVIEAMGYDRSFEEIANDELSGDEAARYMAQNPPSQTPPSQTPPYMLSKERDKVFLMPGSKLDLGGIAKGWIVEQAAYRMRRQGLTNFILNAGGDMVCVGSNDGVDWHVAIESPWEPTTNVLTLDIRDRCVATSGISRRQWRRGTKHMHHIIHPSLGTPADTDVLSCTVVAGSLVAAEVYAKTCIVLGSKTGTEWLSKQNQQGFVVIRKTGEVKHPWSV